MPTVDDLDPELMSTFSDIPEAPSEFAAVLNAHGLYNTMQFVVRLSPPVHALVDSYANTSAAHHRGEIPFEALQAYSTYLHETVHWWQHVGSTAGLVLSLSFPGQFHVSLGELREVLDTAGPRKSLKEWAEQKAYAGEGDEHIVRVANVAVNNAMDIEFYKIACLTPEQQVNIYENKYFESTGHCYEIAYGLTLSQTSGSCDGLFAFLPDPTGWEVEFMRLAQNNTTGFYYGSPLIRVPTGLRGIFEGQARFAQLQYLFYKTDVTFRLLGEHGYFDGIYGEAFKAFLDITNLEWPEKFNDPVCGIFMLVLDMAMNPTRGFPLQIHSFETFLLDVDPGIRFLTLSHAVRDRPELLDLIHNYTRDEYDQAVDILAKETGYDHPFVALAEIGRWLSESPDIAELMKEYDTFEYGPTNVPVRVIFSHFLAFSRDKLANPEFFCWPGAWMGGERVHVGQRLFLSHLSLFSDKENDDGIFPRHKHGRSEKNTIDMFNRFYQTCLIYDLARQWIICDGPFRYDFSWLSTAHDEAQFTRAIKDLFRDQLGVDPDDFDILK